MSFCAGTGTRLQVATESGPRGAGAGKVRGIRGCSKQRIERKRFAHWAMLELACEGMSAAALQNWFSCQNPFAGAEEAFERTP